jgi:phosphodiesterase/alkaline phosphatase D-like protein
LDFIYVGVGNVKRRSFIYKAVLGVGSLGALLVAPSSWAALGQAKKPLTVCFHTESVATLTADGTWRISAMADPRSQAPQFIRLVFEVATDEQFENVVFRNSLLAKKSDSYIVRASYHPESEEELYFRFVAPDVVRASQRSRFAPQVHASPVQRLGRA